MTVIIWAPPSPTTSRNSLSAWLFPLSPWIRKSQDALFVVPYLKNCDTALWSSGTWTAVQFVSFLQNLSLTTDFVLALSAAGGCKHVCVKNRIHIHNHLNPFHSAFENEIIQWACFNCVRAWIIGTDTCPRAAGHGEDEFA